ncbi:MAG: NAD(P)H-dependent oxidoreductase subunit E [Bacillota bacterium]|nr:NAD(P)H-dependent oxidoreductase subunit E [Bacillota bacterium]
MKALEENLRLGQKDPHIQQNGSIISLLQEIQERYNYLPEDVLRDLAKKRNVSLMEIFSIATFYKSFSLTPKGKHKIVTCSGTACHVRGSEKVTREISRKLGIEPGSTTEDGEYSLESVNCLGACALAPLVVIDDQYFGSMSSAKILEIINGYATKDAACSCHAQTEEETPEAKTA